LLLLYYVIIQDSTVVSSSALVSVWTACELGTFSFTSSQCAFGHYHSFLILEALRGRIYFETDMAGCCVYDERVSLLANVYSCVDCVHDSLIQGDTRV